MAHSPEEFGGERVGKFVMSVIEAASTSRNAGGGARVTSRNKNTSVSPHPIIGPFRPTSTTKSTRSQSSQELVEDSLGSLATLLSVSSSNSFVQGDNGIIKVVVAKSSEKLLTKRKGNAPRRNLLRRKKSSLTAVPSPEDLGRVSKSSSQLDALSPSPPAVVVTHPSSSSSTSPSPFFNDKGEKITGSSPKNYYDHPSTFHLRKPISTYKNNNSNNNSSNHNNDNKQKSEIKIGSTNNRTSGGALKNTTTNNAVVGQRSPNYTDSKDNPEPSLHNNSNASSVNIVGSSKDKSHHHNITSTNNNNKLQNSGNNANQDPATIAAQVAEKNDSVDADDDKKKRRQELDNHDDDRHGQLCVHHYHHHSHHHHYHYYENSDQQNSARGHRRHSHHHNHPSFPTNNNNQRADGNDDDSHCHDQQKPNNTMREEDINSSTGLIPQQEQQHYLHNHQTMMMMIKDDMHSSSPAEHPPKSPPPSHEYHLDDISFYRKFSATSPPPTARRHRRSKSSMEWATAGKDFNVIICSGGGGRLCSKTKRQKSRSTPVCLDVVGKMSKNSHPAPPSLPLEMFSDGPVLYQYGCKCGGCLYCCNALSCNCCCDECCCARQFNHVSTSLDNVSADEVTKEKVLKTNSGSEKGFASTTSAILNTSRSVDSIISCYGNNDEYVIDDEEVINDPDSFIEDHLLRHLELFDTDVDDDDDDEIEEEEKEQQDDPNSIGKVDQEKDGKNGDTGQLHLISIERKETGAPENSHQLKNNSDGMNSTTDSLAVLGNNRGGSSAELIPARRSTSIVIVRKTPTRSSVHRGTEIQRNSSNENGSRRRRSTNPNILRTANGEIRSSPILPLPVYLASSAPGNSNRTSSGGIVVVEERTQRSALMTVTVDSMSLFLDAVHLQMNQG